MALTDVHITVFMQFIFLVVLACVVSFAAKQLCDYYKNNHNTPVRAILTGAVRNSLICLPWLILLLYMSHLWLDHDEAEWHDNLLIVERAFLILIPAWLLWRISDETPALIKVIGPDWGGRVSGSIVSRGVQVVILLIALGSIAQMLGYSLSALLTFGGIGGIIIGMAAREWLANFFGGLMLMLDRPFTEGDWIRSPDRSIEGHVEAIGWRLTRIRTFDRRPIYVPNSLFTGIVVENPSRMRNRRMLENFGLRYEDQEKLPLIFSRIMELVEDNPDIDSNEPKYACFIRYDDSSLLCQVRVHIKRTDRVGFLQVQQWVLMIVAQVVAEQGAEFAYPTRKLLNN
ncbi:hypothetical protein ACH42_12020 [Endozoicomonas sp. (ex Bugula neritina AB1)]|nr:hypothetical protein ACH42_12020 [Endozoicomonas sp. (ex Bugula neritina AB1)]